MIQIPSSHKLDFELLVHLKYRQCNLSTNVIILKSFIFKVNQIYIVKSFIYVLMLIANVKVFLRLVF